MEMIATIITDILKKISRYEIINNLIPGFVLYVILNLIGIISLEEKEILIKFLVCYILGIINCRFSSLVVEELSRFTKFVQWRDYSKYNKAKKERPFVATLQESANMYRSFASVFLLSLFSVFYKFVCDKCEWINNNGYWIILVLLFLLFLFSYRKQVNDYVVKNIDEVNNKG